MKDLEIFDKNGKALHMADVISRFIELKAGTHNLTSEQIALYFEGNGIVEIGQIEPTGEYIRNVEELYVNSL